MSGNWVMIYEKKKEIPVKGLKRIFLPILSITAEFHRMVRKDRGHNKELSDIRKKLSINHL